MYQPSLSFSICLPLSLFPYVFLKELDCGKNVGRAKVIFKIPSQENCVQRYKPDIIAGI